MREADLVGRPLLWPFRFATAGQPLSVTRQADTVTLASACLFQHVPRHFARHRPSRRVFEARRPSEQPRAAVRRRCQRDLALCQ